MASILISRIPHEIKNRIVLPDYGKQTLIPIELGSPWEIRREKCWCEIVTRKTEKMRRDDADIQRSGIIKATFKNAMAKLNVY
jgi:hypothetical protein